MMREQATIARGDAIMDRVTSRIDLPARVLVAVMFLVSGFGKFTAAAATEGYLAAYGLPTILVWPAAAWEVTAGILLVAGLFTRPLALLLAGWCMLTALIFHTALHDPNQVIHFLKNLSLTGLFLLLAKHGSDNLSVDAWLRARRRF